MLNKISQCKVFGYCRKQNALASVCCFTLGLKFPACDKQRVKYI